MALKRRPMLRDISAYGSALLLLMWAIHQGGPSFPVSMGLMGVYVLYIIVLIFI